MATLTGKKIKNTYDALLKLSDNDNLTTTAKQVTDGFGNNAPLYISTTQIGIGVTPETGYDLHVYSDAKVGGNLTITGDLTVNGTTTTVDTDTLRVEDPLIEVARNNTSADSVDIGIYGKYTPVATTLYAGLFRDAGDDKFKLFKSLEEAPTTTVNTAGTGYAVATLVADVEGTLTGTIASSTVATTQSQNDNSTKVATTAYVDLAVDGVDTLAEVLAIGNTTGGTDISVSSGDDITFADSSKSIYGAGSDLQVYHDGSNSLILNDTGKLIIRNRADNSDIQFDCDDGSGGVVTYFYLDGSEVNTRFPKDIKLNDNTKAIFGGGGDLEIYHDGSNSYISDTGTGNLVVRTSAFRLQSSGGEDMIAAFENDTVKLYYDNSQKLSTTSTGITVTGGISTSNSITLSNPTDKYIRFIDTYGNWDIEVGDGANNFKIHSGSLNADYLTIEGGGQIQFNEYGSGSFTGTATYRLAVDSSGDVIEIPIGDGAVDGSGTANTVTMWSDTDTITDAPITISGNNATFTGDVTVSGGDLTVGDDTGNVNIDLAGGTSSNLTINFGDSDDDNIGKIIYRNASDQMGFITNTVQRMLIDSSGRVGIGTSSPLAKLHVENGSSGAGSAWTNADELIIENSGNVGLTLQSPNTAAATIAFQDPQSVQAGWIQYLHASNVLRFATNGNNERMRIDGNGNIGIGTTSPNNFGFLEKVVHINAGTSSSTTLQQTGLVISGSSDANDADDFGYVSFLNNHSTLSNDRVAEIRITKNGTDVDTGQFTFYTSNGTSLTQALLLDSSQNATFTGSVTVNNQIISEHTSADIPLGSTTANLWLKDDRAIAADVGGSIVFSGKYSGTTYLSGGPYIKGYKLNATDNDYSFGLKFGIRKNGAGVSGPVLTLDPDSNATFAGMITVNGGGIDIDNNDDIRLRFDNAGTFKAGLQVVTTSGDMIAGSGVNDFAIRANENMLFATGGNTERMRIDSSGDLIMKGGRIIVRESDNGNDAVKITRDADEGYVQLFSSGTQTIEIRGNGNSYFNGGSVGIGTSSPTELLEVDGNIRLGDGGQRNIIGPTNQSLGIFANPNSSTEGIIFSTDGGTTTEMFIQDGGKVGIGTTSPSGELMVRKDQAGSPTRIIVSNNGTAQSGTTARLSFYEGTSEKNYIERRRDGTGQFAFVTPADDNPIVWENASGEFMRFTNSKVGIGTTSPSYKLHVESSDDILAMFKSTDNKGVIRISDNDTNGYISSENSRFSIGFNVGLSANNLNFHGSNLGFGTSSPSKQLTLSAATPFIRLQETGGGSKRLDLWVDSNAVAHIDANQSAQQITFRTASTDRLRIANNGNVGIGTTSPSTLLHIEGASVGYLQTIKNTTAGGDYLQMLAETGDAVFQFQSGGTGGEATLNMYRDGTQYVKISADAGVNNYFNNGANVGIGTTSPSAKLEIEDSGADLLDLTRTSVGTYRLAISSSDNFSIYDVGAASDRLVIDNTGKVGIGTTSPSHKLHVNGNVFGESFGNGTSTYSRIFAPAGAKYNGGQSVTGALTFILPQTGVNCMLTVKIRVFDYAEDEQFDVHASGYYYTGNNWTRVSAWIDSVAHKDRNFSVRFGRRDSDGKGTIHIGETNSSWSYVKFGIVEVVATHSNGQVEKWNDGWSTTVLSSYTGYTVVRTQSNCQVNNWQRDGQNAYYGGTGNVGIGETNPTSFSSGATTLHIKGTVTSKAGAIRLRSSNNSIDAFIYPDSTNGMSTGTLSNHSYRILTNNAERMRITNGGNVGIGLTSPTYKFHVKSSNNVSIFEDSSGSSGATFCLFNAPSNFAMGSITRNGSATSVLFNTSSDYRLKEDLQDFNALDLVDNITAYDYKWKDTEQRDYGFVAHELQEIMPNVVSGEKDGEEMQKVDYSKLTPVLLKAIQELKAEIETLKAQINN